MPLSQNNFHAPAPSRPLVVGGPDRLFAIRGERRVSVRQFLDEVHRLASGLPERPYVINLCESRYGFALSFAAAILRGQISLLPSNRAPLALERLAERYPGAYRQGDDDLAGQVGEISNPLPPGRSATEADVCDWRSGSVRAEAPDGPMSSSQVRSAQTLTPTGFTPLASLSPEGEGLSSAAPLPLPDLIPEDQTVAIVFTSGSTGEPQAHRKTWQIFSDSARLIADSLGIASLSETALVATVPPQHMYGLELSVLLPFCHGGVLVDAKPFFPADIRSALEALPAPRQLVTTPVHLRACVESGEVFPALEGVVSATAPLEAQLAERAEILLRCPVQEVYGCSEAGSLARRRTVGGEVWQAFPGVQFGDGEVTADHLPAPVPIGDLIEPAHPAGFRLLGRDTDLVNVAGKRSSLGALTHALLEIEGVRDAAYCQPADETHGRLVALAVAPGMSREQLLRELRARVDPVFLPRPLHLVERLPRSETGKLTRQALEEFLAKLRANS